MSDDHDAIAIIGGGFTGLVAALRLAQAGHAVELFERGETLGGLASGFEMHGASIERTYHHIFRTDADMIELVRELGIEDRLHWHESSLAIYWGAKMWPFTTPRDLLHFTPLPFASRLRVGLVVLYLQHRGRQRQFQYHTAMAWMRRHAGRAATAVIWEPLLRGKFGRFAGRVSMAWLSARLWMRANSRHPVSDIELLGYFDGGFNVVVQTLRERLEALHVRLRTCAAVERLVDGTCPSVVINGEVRQFAAVVATIPSHLFAKLLEGNERLSDSYLHQLESVQYLGALCMVFSSTQDLKSAYWVNVNAPEAPFRVFINHTRLVGRARYDEHSVYYAGSYLPHDHPSFTESDSRIEEIWFAYIAKMFPEFDISAIVERHITRFRNAQHVVDCGYEDRIPAYATPVPNFYLANFSQIFPEDRGTNFAVREGGRIAALVSRSLANR
jgi:protoporphyrinogen oxidase